MPHPAIINKGRQSPAMAGRSFTFIPQFSLQQTPSPEERARAKQPVQGIRNVPAMGI
jgi:hypothetical protein